MAQTFDESEPYDNSDDWEDSYVKCPHCGEMMLEDAEYCPYCDRWMTQEETRPGKLSPWAVVVVLILIATMVVAVIF